MSDGFGWRNAYDRSVQMPYRTEPGFNPGWRSAPAEYIQTPYGPAQRMVIRAEQDPNATAWQKFNYPSPWEAPRVQAPFGSQGRQPVFPRVVPTIADPYRRGKAIEGVGGGLARGAEIATAPYRSAFNYASDLARRFGELPIGGPRPSRPRPSIFGR